MPVPQFRIFFDTSVYIAGLLSPAGGAGELLRLAEVGAVIMVVSEDVIRESEAVLGRKFPDLIQDSRSLWRSLGPDIATACTDEQLDRFAADLLTGDAEILCAASRADVSAFVTWNTRDFMKTGVDELVSMPMVIPSECLRLVREWAESYLD